MTMSDLVLVNLEDLWLERRPQNVPGTGPEPPNRRHRARHTLEPLTVLPVVNETLRWLAHARTLRTPARQPSPRTPQRPEPRS